MPETDLDFPIYYHFEKPANRMLSALMRNKDAWIFLEPVDPVKLGINNYFDVIK